MKYCATVFACLCVLACMLVGCAPKVESSTAAAALDSLPSTINASAAVPKSELPAATDYETLSNGEIVVYCLPYPKGEFSEEFDRAEYKGQHVLVSTDKQSTITFSGNPVDMTWAELVAESVKDVNGMQGAKLVNKTEGSDHLVLEWTLGEQQHYFKKWYRKADAESVTAHLDFPQAQATKFKPWIAQITASSTSCE